LGVSCAKVVEEKKKEGKVAEMEVASEKNREGWVAGGTMEMRSGKKHALRGWRGGRGVTVGRRKKKKGKPQRVGKGQGRGVWRWMTAHLTPMSISGEELSVMGELPNQIRGVQKQTDKGKVVRISWPSVHPGRSTL